jgi:hypothetical protein
MHAPVQFPTLRSVRIRACLVKSEMTCKISTVTTSDEVLTQLPVKQYAAFSMSHSTWLNVFRAYV